MPCPSPLSAFPVCSSPASVSAVDPIEKANSLIEALPYLQAFRGMTFVIKMGGSAMEDPDLVARVMREAGIAAKTRRKFRQTTDSNHPHPVAPTVLGRAFDPDEPNVSWVADVTYVPTREGWL